MSKWKSINTAPMDGTSILGLWLPRKGTHQTISGMNYGITAYNAESKHWYDTSNDQHNRPASAGPG